MNKIAIYPGTFDPITKGHLDIAQKALGLFDEVIIAVASNSAKNPLFTLDQRVELAKIATSGTKKIKVVGFDSLLFEFAKSMDVKYIIRGLRAVSDFEYEFQMSYANHSLNSDLESVFLMPSIENSFISSTIVRSVLHYGGDIFQFVPANIVGAIDDFISHNRGL